MDNAVLTLIAAVVVLVIFFFGFLALLAKFYRKVEQGHAMIVNTMQEEPEVTFTERLVIRYPCTKVEEMDASMKTIEIERSGKEGLICKDNMRADIKVKFFVRVNKTAEDVLRVAQAIGCVRASHQDTLEDLFSAKFSEALKTVGKSLDFVDLYQARDRFRDEIVRQIGDDLPVMCWKTLPSTISNRLRSKSSIRTTSWMRRASRRSPNSPRKRTSVPTSSVATKKCASRRKTSKPPRRCSNSIVRKPTPKRTSCAKSRSPRRVKKPSRPRCRLRSAPTRSWPRLLADQQIAVQNENVKRETEVAHNNRLRAVAIEEEKVTRARQLEIVDREREVTLQQIEKEKAVEVQKKAIADVIRERIVVERTVAEQEEEIKNVRMRRTPSAPARARWCWPRAKRKEQYIAQTNPAEADEQRARQQGGGRADLGRGQAGRCIEDGRCQEA